MKVLFDYQIFSEQRYGGISRYFANIMQAMDQRDDVSYQVAALYTGNYYIRDMQLPMQDSLGERLLKKPKRQVKWNQRYSSYLLKQGKYDIFHPTYYHPYFLKSVRKPFVVTVHDLIHERYPEAFAHEKAPVSQYQKQVLPRADKIIAISQSTKNDLVNLLNIPREKIEVIYHGVQIRDFPEEKLPFTLGIPQEYVLYVGDRNPYKNFNRFAEAMAPVMKHHKNLFVVCTGGLRFSMKEIEWLTKLDIIHRFIRLNATDQELATLYQHARAFVFPSLFEGFGFPILEAFQNCCPVVCSKTSSFPEVAGNAVQYFDPADTASMTASILRVLDDQMLRAQLIQAGKERLIQFPIQKCVNQTIGLYKQLT